MKFTAKDCQQIATDGSRIVSIHPAGPYVVRVHEARDAQVTGTPFRFYLSVDLKFKPRDALKDWTWQGNGKAETTRDANELAAKLSRMARQLEPIENDIMAPKDRDILYGMISTKLNRILSHYTSEVI